MAVRYLIPILGDQLSRTSALFDRIDSAQDVIVMGEVAAEIRRHPNHRQRVILFLSAMRHFRDELQEAGYRVVYQEIGESGAGDSLSSLLTERTSELQPERILFLEPGRAGIEQEFLEIAGAAGVEAEVLDDTHFLLTRDEFSRWAEGRKSLVAETFYRMMRRRTGYLMEGGKPVGGSWNYDRENRKSFRAGERPEAPAPIRFEPDSVTETVRQEVRDLFPDLPGDDSGFGWPVTPRQAQLVLDDFILHRLPLFGPYQDAMWEGDGWLYHSTLSAAMNLRMLDPRQAIEAALDAYRTGQVPLNSVEGFVRQIIGWREFIRGIYWLRGDELRAANALRANRDLPDLFWTGDTTMSCLSDVVGQLIETAYAHHIQRLMVAGLFCQIYGVEPGQVHDWFMAFYVDSVEWVTLPNTMGMSQYADGGIVGTKPYIASGKYIDRMSNHCGGCRYNPDAASGDEACPFSTLYWDFIERHRDDLESNARTVLQVRNYDRKSQDERAAIAERARDLHEMISRGEL